MKREHKKVLAYSQILISIVDPITQTEDNMAQGERNYITLMCIHYKVQKRE